MDFKEAMLLRHSVRSFTDKRIEGEVEASLRAAIDECNRESGLHIQLFLDEPRAFEGALAHYGKITNCKNYIALVGKKGSDELCGYYGEKIVLTAQALGLNTCWVALTYSKGKVRAVCDKGEKLLLVIALGYGVTQGVRHRSKAMEELCRCGAEMPSWFRAGMEAAMNAPTAMNQQKFLITLENGEATAKALRGPCSRIDLGIVKFHFELGAGREMKTQ